MMSKPYLICIQGPTASGKTELALRLADEFPAEIISADSRQFYKELTIGTAKPDQKQLSQAKHHFIGFISIHEEYNASDYEKDALKIISNLHQDNKIPILAGGSSLYVNAVLEGFHKIPDVPVHVRESIVKTYEKEGLEPLLIRLKKIDPLSYERIDRKNFRRVLRALEVSEASGKPYSGFLKRKKEERDFQVLKIGLRMDKGALYERINQRCDEMIKKGLLDEIEPLMTRKPKILYQTIGYQEFMAFFEGEKALGECIEKFKQHSRNYAKKQLTWLRRDKDIVWFEPGSVKDVLTFVRKFIK